MRTKPRGMACVAVAGLLLLAACASRDRSFYEADPGDIDRTNLVVALAAQNRGDDAGAARAYARLLRNTGHPLAETMLGRYYAEGKGVPKDTTKAAELLQSAYAKNWPNRGLPAYYLARLYDSGDGVPEDKNKAFELYSFAYANRIRPAAYPLAVAYNEGVLAPKDTAKAKELFAVAAANGDPRGNLRVAEIDLAQGQPSEEVYKEARPAVAWLRDLAKDDNDWAAYQLANIYTDGKLAPANPELAQRYTRDAAKYGNASANARMAEQEERDGDEKRALSYWRRAAEGGHPSGMVKLGFAAIDAGKEEEGLEWLKKAAALGHASAEAEIGRRELTGDGVTANPEDGVAMLKRAADAGHPSAMYSLGNAYANGEGVAKDPAQARLWYGKARDAGHPNAAKALRALG